MRFFISICFALKLCAVVSVAEALSPDDSRHLLLRTGFGVDAAGLDAVSDLSRADAVRWVLEGVSTEPMTDMPAWTVAHTPDYWRIHRMPEADRQRFREQRDQEMLELRGAWLREMIETPSPLTERLALFWHNHFVTSYESVRMPTVLARQLDTFRQHGLGNYRTLLKEMIRDPALLLYLNNDESRKDHPNENLGRELLELFTLGDGHYDEKDVQAAASALTGFDLHPPRDFRYFFNAWNADEQSKRFLGTSIVGGDDLIDAILAQDRAAVFLTEEMWDHFISIVERDEKEIARIANRFRASDYDLRVLLETLLMSDAFWDTRNRGHLIKSPVELVVGTVRSLGLTLPLSLVVSVLSELDQTGFDQRNVAGWPEGLAWLTPAALAERRRQLERLQEASGETLPIPRRSRLQVRLAGTGYEGAPDYRIEANVSGQGWQLLTSGTTAFARDTERYGWPDEMGRDLVWQTISVDDSALPNAIERIRVRFTNDLANENGGDRNLWVAGLRLDDQDYAASEALTKSCGDIRDDGALFCEGSVTFTMQTPAPEPVRKPFDGFAVSDIWGNWADPPSNSDDWQEMSFTLRNPRLGDRQWRNITLRYVLWQGEDFLILSSRDCWPDCLAKWPEAAWYEEDTGEYRIIISSDPENEEYRAQWQQLGAEGKRLVSSIGQAMPVVLAYLEKDPAFPEPEWRQAWMDRLKPLAHRLAGRFSGADHIRVQPMATDAGGMAMMMGAGASLLDRPVLPSPEQPRQRPASWLVALPPLVADSNSTDVWSMVYDPVYQVK